MVEYSRRLLTVADAPELAALLAAQRPAYLAHFHPFAFDLATLTALLAPDRKDRFWGQYFDHILVGFYMLRGFDAGYTRPAFGVFVAEAASGQRLARRALAEALDWSATHGIERVMLKVSAENPAARRVYLAAGFEFLGICPDTGHEMFEKRLSPAPLPQ